MTHAGGTEPARHQADLLIFADLVFPDRILRNGWLAVRGGRILALGNGQPPPADQVVPLPDHLILPGFIDLHLHGLENGDPTSADGLQKMLTAAVRHGVTGLTPALASATQQDYLTLFDNARAVQKTHTAGARLLGVHAEGPHINPRMARGMDPNFLWPPDPHRDSALLEHGQGLLKLMTLSPELPGATNLIEKLVDSGVTASIGHSAASPRQVRQAVRAGATQVCHWPNALPKPEREPDLPDTAGACLRQPELTLEIIPDLVHVPVEKLSLAVRTAGIERLVTVTDGMRGSGLPLSRPGAAPVTLEMTDGRRYHVDPQRGCRLVETDVLVGSAITLLEAFQNLVKTVGLTIPQASRVCSTNPARQIGLGHEMGALAEGYLADLTVLTRDLELVATLVGGTFVYQRPRA